MDAAGRVGSHAGGCAPSVASPPPRALCTPGPPVCPQALPGEPRGDVERGKAPMGHHCKPSPSHGHPISIPQAPMHGCRLGRTPPEPTAPREPGAPHNMTRLIPEPAAPLPDSTGVTPWAAPGPHADDTPYNQRQPHRAAPTPGQRAQQATAARTRPGQAPPRPRHLAGQRQRNHPPAEPPRGPPSPRTRPSVAPCSEALLPATLPGTATEQYTAPRSEEATRTANQWTPTHAPTGNCCARRHQNHAHSR